MISTVAAMLLGHLPCILLYSSAKEFTCDILSGLQWSKDYSPYTRFYIYNRLLPNVLQKTPIELIYQLCFAKLSPVCQTAFFACQHKGHRERQKRAWLLTRRVQACRINSFLQA